MDANARHEAAPIFVIGSPRSGTSILTWCLGQHPNILVTEESDWLGPFAEQLGAHFEIGSARGERSQLSALGVERDAFFRAFGDAIDALILGQRRCLEQLSHAAAQRDARQVSADIAISRDAAEPKARWVDGTPEYSLYVCGLHKLFPAAKFVHIVRDADEVAASMLAFQHVGGAALVEDAESAYEYWLRTTQACLLAEQVLGVGRVYRLRHVDLVADPEVALRGVFDFLGEPFLDDCLGPLTKRINSSFAEDAQRNCPRATSALIEQARHLSAQILESGPLPTVDADMRGRWEAAFAERVQFARNLRADCRNMQQVLAGLQLDLKHGADWVREKNEQVAQAQASMAEKQVQLAKSQRALGICGALFAAQLIAAAALFADGTDSAARGFCLLVAAISVLSYAWLRRAGLRNLLRRLPAEAKAPRADRPLDSTR